MIECLRTEGFTDDMTVVKQNSVDETYPLHTHTFYEFFLVSKGRALHLVNDVAQIVERGSLVLIRPSDRHCYNYYLSHNFEFYNVGITPERIEAIRILYGQEVVSLFTTPLPSHVFLDENTTRRMEEYLIELKYREPGIRRDQLFMMLLSMVIYYILTASGEQKSKHIPDWLVHLLDEMEKPENFTRGLPKLLELVHYTQEYINRSFRLYLHTTPTRYINEKRLAYAKQLLAASSHTVLEISGLCGFTSLSHFNNCYKEFYGSSPTKDRK